MPFTLLFFLALSINVSAYTMNYIYQDDGSVNNVVTPPSFQWKGNCLVDIKLYTTTTHSGSYSLNQKWYSPNEDNILIYNPILDSNITCRLSGIGNTTENLNDFYESRTTTQSTATITDTWVNTTFECDAVDDLIIYDDTLSKDSFGNYPYAYSKIARQSCSTSYATDIENDLHFAIENLTFGYFELCGSDLKTDRQNSGSFGCTTSHSSLNYFTMIPFDSSATGTVNIT